MLSRDISSTKIMQSSFISSLSETIIDLLLEYISTKISMATKLLKFSYKTKGIRLDRILMISFFKGLFELIRT